MATFFEGESHTFSEYLLVPGYSSAQNIPANVSLKTPLVKFKKGEQSPIMLNIPMVSAIMQSVSGTRLAIALAQQGGVSFIYGSQSAEDEAAMVREVKTYKAGFVVSDSTLTPDMTLSDVLELVERTGHSTMPVTADGSPTGQFRGIVTSRDYRVSRDDPRKLVKDFMTPADRCIVANEKTTLKQANDIIWEHKLNVLPIVSAKGNLVSLVFRKDYDSHKSRPDELLDEHKRYIVGAGINTRDFAERVPMLLEAGADVLCATWSMPRASAIWPSAAPTLSRLASAAAPSASPASRRASAVARPPRSSTCVPSATATSRRPACTCRCAPTAASSTTTT